MSRAILKRTFKVAERIQHLLDERGVRSALIGAMACAAWGYPRHTRDFDLGCLASLGVLEDLARVLAKPGLEIELRTPDSDDPLGGMLIISGKGLRRIELINFLNPYRPGRKNPGGLAMTNALEGRLAPSAVRLVALEDLIALKLYAGGPKSRLDVHELLARNPELDISRLRERCVAGGVGGELERVLAERDS